MKTPVKIEWNRLGHEPFIVFDNDVDEGGKKTLTIPISDEEDAREIVAAIEKLDNAAPKKPRKPRKVSPAPVAAPPPPPAAGSRARVEVPMCRAPGCSFWEDVPGSGECRDHATKKAS